MLHFFFNDTATTEIYTLSLHDALPISCRSLSALVRERVEADRRSAVLARAAVRVNRRELQELQLLGGGGGLDRDRKSTRLNSSHANISYGGLCLKKKSYL